MTGSFNTLSTKSDKFEPLAYVLNSQLRWSTMKCLSLKQPFAELLISGKKTVELRKWNTKFRGKFLIHASKKIDEERAKSLGIDCAKLSTGAIIGTAILYNVKGYESKAEFERDKNKHCADIKKFGSYKYGFMIRNAHRLRAVLPYPGQLKFFEVEYPVIPY
jgi:ASCH domain